VNRGWIRREKVRRFVNYLTKSKMVETTHQPTHQTTHLRLLNYERFNRSATHQTTHQPTQIQEVQEHNTRIILRDGTFFEVTSKIIKQFKMAYPGLDVESELGAIAAWNISNPSKRKTKSGIMRHINSWLSRASSERRKREEPKTDVAGRHYNFVQCPHCGTQTNVVKKGKPCPWCEKKV
jgi:hypothetical protein